MKTASKYFTTLSHMSNRLQHDTSSIPPILLIDDYNLYYLDLDYDFDPYWDTHSFHQHNLYFCSFFTQQTQDLEPDSPESDNALNPTLANACVDPWQRKCHFTHQPAAPGPGIEIHRGDHRSLWLQQLLRAL